MGKAAETTLIRWWCRKRKLAAAGIRIRAHLVMRELRRLGHDADWFDPAHPHGITTLVLHKRYDADTRAVVKQLRNDGVRIVFDLCDNYFYNPGQLPEWKQRANDLRAMLQLADKVVVPTVELGTVIASECGAGLLPVVIPDACDDLAEVPARFKDSVKQFGQARKLRNQILGHKDRTALLWFGIHGNHVEGGMLDLLRIRHELESLNEKLPLLLTVLSNNRRKFESNFRNWTFPVIYGDWSAKNFSSIASRHQIALIPVQDNPYTRVKSENRLVTSFTHGLAVVADPLPSYRAFADMLFFGNWAQSIETYASCEAIRRQHVEAGRRFSQEKYGITTIAQQWLNVIRA